MTTRIEVEIGGLSLAEARRRFEAEFLAAKLRETGCVMAKAAHEAGLHYETFRNKCHSLGVKVGRVAVIEDASR